MIQTMVDRFRSRFLERYFVPTLIVAALGSVVISLMIGLQQSVWFDEANTVLLAKQSSLSLMHLTSVDAHPPLYYLLLKTWAGIFGWSELALRSFSVVAMSGAVVLGGLLVRRMFGVRAALMTLPFVALSPLLLRYGFEMRMYALAALIGIAATYALVAALETKAKSRQWKLYVIYALLLALGIYTHYLMALLLAVHLVWLVWRAYREKQRIFKTPWFVAITGAVVLFLPWVPALISRLGDSAQTATAQPMSVDSLAGIVSFTFLYQPAWQLGGYGTILLAFLTAALCVFVVRAFKKASKKERDYLWLLAFYVLVPVVLIALISLIQPMYVERYASLFVMGGLLLVGVAVAYSARKLSSFAGLATVVVYAVLLLGVGQLAKVGNTNYQQLQKPAVKEAAAALAPCGHSATILAADPYVAIELSYYLPSCEVRFYSSKDELKGGYAALSESPLRIAQPEVELANSTKLYYVYYDKPRLTMPHNLTEMKHETFGALSVDTFETE